MRFRSGAAFPKKSNPAKGKVHAIIIKVERFRDLGTVPAIVQQQNRVRPARHTVDLTRMPHHRLQGRAFLGAQKSTVKHGQRRTYPRTDRKDFLGSPRRQGIYTSPAMRSYLSSSDTNCRPMTSPMKCASAVHGTCHRYRLGRFQYHRRRGELGDRARVAGPTRRSARGSRMRTTSIPPIISMICRAKGCD